MSVSAPIDASVDDWLEWQLASHPNEIELGLERVAIVADRLGVLPFGGRSVVIAGTNGKGSCAALIESLLQPSGRVGTYTSPHLWRYNERIRVERECVSDDTLCAAFAAVAQARGETALTFFEYGTLAALWCFAEAHVAYAVLEVGLGGRLDAVNIIDAEVALVTNIGLDHVDWLGPDREHIGHEKAGVMRARRPAVCTDRDMPASVAAYARRIDAPLEVIGTDFDVIDEGPRWRWRDGDRALSFDAPDGVLAENLAGALAVTVRLGIEIDAYDIERACAHQARLPGRRERVDGDIPIIYDVGHNAEAIAVLVHDLTHSPVAGRTHVVLGMLCDKPVETAGARLRDVADALYVAGLDRVIARGLDAATLQQRLGCQAPMFTDPSAALAAARQAACAGDRIVVCGSFHTVAAVRRPV